VNTVTDFLKTYKTTTFRMPEVVNAFENAYSLYCRLKRTEEKGPNQLVQILPHFKDYEKYEIGYFLEHRNKDGSVIASKNDFRRFLKAGDYLLTAEPGENNMCSQNVTFKSLSYTFDTQFFHFWGNYFSEHFPQELVRFYFNVKPHFAVNWVNFFRIHLGENSFFFQAKIHHLSSQTSRADNAVIYINRKDIPDFLVILKKLVLKFPHYMEDMTPFFLLKIGPGIGFGENPQDPSESFGSYRCRQIIHLMEAKPACRVSEILLSLKHKGFDIEKFYLNPFSPHSYDFSGLD